MHFNGHPAPCGRKKSILKALMKPALAAALLLAPGALAFAAPETFPMKINDGISATFCEYRRGHLHAGYDLRTRRKTGFEVLAPADGKIAQVYGDENGYGLMLTLEGDDGLIYKFAHLSAFENEKLKLMAAVDKFRAEKNRRYPFEIDFKAADIRVKKGETIAYTGDTGAGPPHLHYEITDKNGLFINPAGIVARNEINDSIPPVISSLTIIPADENSTIEGMPVRRTFNFPKKDGAPLKFNAAGRFMITAKCYDETRDMPDNASRTGIYQLSLAAGGKNVFSLKFDKCHGAFMRRPEYVYDVYHSSISGGNFYYTLFNLNGGAPAEYISGGQNGGIFEVKKGEAAAIEIKAADSSGNVETREFKISGSDLPAEIRAAAKNTAAAGRVKTASAGSKKTKKMAARAATNVRPINMEYTDAGILFTVEEMGPDQSAALHADMDGPRVSYKPLKRSGARDYFFIGYESAVNCKALYLEITDAKKTRVSYEGYRLKVHKVTPGGQISGPEFGRFLFEIREYKNMARPLYAGVEKLFRMSEPESGNAASACAIRFSETVISGKIFYKLETPAGPSSKKSVCLVNKNESYFLGSAVQKIGPDDFIVAGFKYMQRLSLAVKEDSTAPTIRISKSSMQKLTRGYKPSVKADADFITFTIMDRESGTSRDDVKYYIDGAECGNFEYINGTLKCFLSKFTTAGPRALGPGTHNVKLSVSDNAGNVSIFEKNFKALTGKK